MAFSSSAGLGYRDYQWMWGGEVPSCPGDTLKIYKGVYFHDPKYNKWNYSKSSWVLEIHGGFTEKALCENVGLKMWKTLSKSVFRISENLTFMKIFRFLSLLEPLGTSIILFSCALPSTEFSINYTIPPRTSGSSTPLAFLMKINISFYSVRNIIRKQRTKSSEQEVSPADLCQWSLSLASANTGMLERKWRWSSDLSLLVPAFSTNCVDGGHVTSSHWAQFLNEKLPFCFPYS